MNKKQTTKLEELGDSSQYQEQGKYFLEACGVHMEAVKAVPQDAPEWANGGKHGTKWSISLAKIKDNHTLGKYDTLHNQPHSFSEVVTFPFWGSIADKEKGERSRMGEKRPQPYDVIAGLTSMYNDTFEDWCFNYGYDDDSRDAFKTYQRCQELDTKLKKVFTGEEMDALQYIN